MKQLAIVTRMEEDSDYVVLWLLDENYECELGVGIPIAEGVYKDRLKLSEFSIAVVDLVPNNLFDGIIETIEDFEKFDYHIKDLDFISVGPDDDQETRFPVGALMQDGDFWDIVKEVFKGENYESELL